MVEWHGVLVVIGVACWSVFARTERPGLLAQFSHSQSATILTVLPFFFVAVVVCCLLARRPAGWLVEFHQLCSRRREVRSFVRSFIFKMTIAVAVAVAVGLRKNAW